MQRAEYKTASVWGLNVRYVEAGEGPVVLLLHGLADSLLSWYCNIDPLAEAGYRVIALDLPGSGESDKPDHLDYDPGSAAEFIYDFTQELAIERLALVGSSAGGLITGLFALEHPSLVEKAVLVDAGGLGREVSWLLRILSLPVVGDIMYRPKLNDKMGLIKRMFYRPPAVLDELLPEMNRAKLLPGARMATLRGVRSSVNLRGLRQKWLLIDRLKNSDVPLMVIWGAEDIIIPVAHAETVREELSNCIVKVIPECGHWPQMENPSVFNSIIIDFLAGNSTQREQPEP